jgi:glyoxalase family protein
MAWHATLIAQNRNVSPQMDRNYFKSIYFREPGGVLFEVATDAPGFAIDETLESLGESLKIPPMYEHRRRVIESFLPKL